MNLELNEKCFAKSYIPCEYKKLDTLLQSRFEVMRNASVLN